MAELEYVEITGRLAISVGDTVSDPDQDPDIKWCDEGTVRFTPLVTEMRVKDSVEGPFSVSNSPIEAHINSEGRLTYGGQESVKLIDLGSEAVTPRIPRGQGAYRVEFINIRCDNVEIRFAPFTFHPEPGIVNDLTLMAPLIVGRAELVSQVSLGVIQGYSEEVLDARDNLLQIAADTLPSYGAETITSAEVDLRSVNEWIVPNPVTLDLPVRPAGSHYIVHVVSGFQNITWPNGTRVFGMTSDDEAWVALLHGDDRWEVLVGNGEGGGGGGGVEANIINHVTHPILTSSSPLVTGASSLPMLTDFSGPGGTVVPPWDGSIGTSSSSIAVTAGVTPGRVYEYRISYHPLEAHPNPSGDYFQLTTNTQASSASVASLSANALQKVAVARIGQWLRTPPFRFTAPANAVTMTMTTYMRLKTAFNYPTLIDVTDTIGAGVREPFNPDIDPEAIWVGEPNNSKSILRTYREKDEDWLQQVAVGRFLGEGPPTAHPEFAVPVALRSGSEYADTTPTSDRTGTWLMSKGSPTSTGAWTRPGENAVSQNYVVVLASGGMTFPLTGNFADPDSWTVAAAPATTGTLGVSKKSGITTLSMGNIAAKIANPTGAIFVLPPESRPPSGIAFVAPLSTGGSVAMKITKAGAISAIGPIPIGAALGVPGVADDLCNVTVSW